MQTNSLELFNLERGNLAITL